MWCKHIKNSALFSLQSSYVHKSLLLQNKISILFYYTYVRRVHSPWNEAGVVFLTSHWHFQFCLRFKSAYINFLVDTYTHPVA